MAKSTRGKEPEQPAKSSPGAGGGGADYDPAQHEDAARDPRQSTRSAPPPGVPMTPERYRQLKEQAKTRPLQGPKGPQDPSPKQ